MKKRLIAGMFVGLAGMVNLTMAASFHDLAEKAKGISGCMVDNRFSVISSLPPAPNKKIEDERWKKVGNEVGQYIVEKLRKGINVIVFYDQYNFVVCEGEAAKQLVGETKVSGSGEGVGLEEAAKSVKDKANAVSGAIDSLRWLKNSLQWLGR